MYTNYRSIQILLSLMKQNNITNVVLSPGGSDIPLIHSIETDSFFTCFSVVDERSAAYYAMGMAQQLNSPVACVCTSGTAVCNYLPGITEAFYQNTPVLVITADKNPYFQSQLETQKIEQTTIFKGVIKESVDLPIVKDEADEWLCNRLVNEALLSLTHHGRGPAQINIPVVGSYDYYECKELPVERRISIHNVNENPICWNEFAQKLENAKKILVIVGQDLNFTEDTLWALESFFEKYNCIFSVENLSNLRCKGAIRTYPITEIYGGFPNAAFIPDIVISLGNNLAAYCLKPALRNHYKEIENWLLSASGKVRDAYQCLTDIFECEIKTFFSELTSHASSSARNDLSYFNLWDAESKKIRIPQLPLSNFYVAQKLAQIIPDNSMIHCAILNSTRVMQFFDLHTGVKMFSNVGALGIDGCFSTFAGASAVTTELAFLLIGDLSFFYDMNAAGIRSIGPNVRIILLNNGGGSEFHFFEGRRRIPTINDYICAEHKKTAEGWIKSLGFTYYSATTEKEFCSVIDTFAEKSQSPLFLEVFTDMEEDAQLTRSFYSSNLPDSMTSGIKEMLKSNLSEKQLQAVTKIANYFRK